MTAVVQIRKRFRMTQAEFAVVAGATQPTVCRWEKGELEPDRDQLSRIRSHALDTGLPWDDAWFFDAPASTQAAQ